MPCSIPSDNERECVRVIVALTDAGRRYLDAKKRAIELFVVATSIEILAEQGKDIQNGIYSTNVPDLMGPGDHAFELV